MNKTKNSHDSQTEIKTENLKIDRSKSTGRVFGNDFFFIHDLFKLDVSKMIKNVAIDGQQPLLEALEHVHVYHSYDSTGKKQDKSTHVGGHFHIVEIVKEGDDQNPPEIKIGPPCKYVQVRNRRTKHVTKTVVPLEHDSHTHEVSYVRSDKLKPRKVSEEFVKFQSKITTPAKVEGVL